MRNQVFLLKHVGNVNQRAARQVYETFPQIYYSDLEIETTQSSNYLVYTHNICNSNATAATTRAMMQSSFLSSASTTATRILY